MPPCPCGGCSLWAAMSGLFGIGNRIGRRFPFVALLLDFPRLGLAVLQAHVGARIGRPAEADLIPGPRMGVIRLHAILHQQRPIALDRHFLPDVRRALPWVSRRGSISAVRPARRHESSAKWRAVGLLAPSARWLESRAGMHRHPAAFWRSDSRGCGPCAAARRCAGRSGMRRAGIPVILRQDVRGDAFPSSAPPPGVKKRIGGISCTRSRTFSRVAASQNFCWPSVLKPG